MGYIKKKHPEMENLISRTPSPMVMIGLHIKEKDPDAKVIFIGPCVAKKKEFQLGRTMNAIDCALTYEELFAMFQVPRHRPGIPGGGPAGRGKPLRPELRPQRRCGPGGGGGPEGEGAG